MMIEQTLLSRLEKFPFISFYAQTRGWYFILSWCHRITGILLVIFVWFHIYALPSLYWLGNSGGNTRAPQVFILSLLAWVLAIPVVFHAFNGGRLILYESFGRRDDASMIRWVFGLSILYLAILGIIMLMGDQSVSPFLFWLLISAAALIGSYVIRKKIRDTGHSIFWKCQRISGVFLVVMVPAYILFLHLNAMPDWETTVAAGLIQDLFIRIVHVGLLVGILYHGGYGLWSVVSDYLPSRGIRTGFTGLVVLVSLIFFWLGIRIVLNA